MNEYIKCVLNSVYYNPCISLLIASTNYIDYTRCVEYSQCRLSYIILAVWFHVDSMTTITHRPALTHRAGKLRY